MPYKSYKKESRADWGRDLCPSQNIGSDDIKLGAILRIADACELMAKRYQGLIDERDRYKRWYESERQTTARLFRQISGLRGHITRLKKAKK